MLNRRSAIGGFLGSLGMMGSVNKNGDVFINGYGIGKPLRYELDGSFSSHIQNILHADEAREVAEGRRSLGSNPPFKYSTILLINSKNPFVNEVYVGMDTITACAGSLNYEKHSENDLGGDSYIIIRESGERAGLHGISAEATEYLRECDYPECDW